MLPHVHNLITKLKLKTNEKVLLKFLFLRIRCEIVNFFKPNSLPNNTFKGEIKFPLHLQSLSSFIPMISHQIYIKSHCIPLRECQLFISACKHH